MYKSIAELRKAEEAFSKLSLLDNSIMNIAFKDNIPAVQHIVRIILDKSTMRKDTELIHKLILKLTLKTIN